MPEYRNQVPTSGRAVQLSSFAGPEVLEIREVPDPHARGQVGIRVTAAGLNPMD
jgi:NADPH:quinone reductase-like Zn-dependent oxidoreductase